MAVNLSVKFQDQYSQGLQQVVEELEKQEEATQKLKETTEENNEALRRMAREHEEVRRAMAGSREASGSASVQLSKASTEMLKASKEGKEAKKTTDGLSTAFNTLALRAGKIGLILKGIQLAYKGVTAGDSGGLVTEHLKDTANNLFGLDKMWKQLKEEVTPGVVALRDARDEMIGISKESRKLADELAKQAKHWKALRESRGGIEQARKAELELRELRKITTKDKVETELQLEREKFAKLVTAKKKDEEAIGKSQKRITDLIARSYEIEDELMEKRQEAVRKAIEREHEMRRTAGEAEVSRSEAWMKQQITGRVENVAEREAMIHRIERESAVRRHKLVMESAQSEEERIKAKFDLQQQLRDIDFNHHMAIEQQKMEAEQKAADHERELQSLRQQAIVGQQDRNLRLMQDRIVRRIDAEKEADLKFIENTKTRSRIEVEAEEKKHAAIRELERQAILNKAALETNATKDRTEQARIAARTIEELREMEFRHSLEMEQKRVEVAKAAADRELAIEREKIDRIKALTDKQGKNTFESLMAQQGQRRDDQGRNRLFEQVVKNRMADAMKKDPDMSRHEQQQTNRLVRRQTMRGMTATGERTSEAEIQRAQSDMAANVVLQAHKQGKVNTEFVKAMAEQAKAFREKNAFDEEVLKSLTELQNAGKTQQQLEQARIGRLRAQRRGMRG